MASSGHTLAQLPYPIQPYSHPFGPPPGTLAASTQLSIPVYLNLSPAFSQVPAHLTNAVIFTNSPASTPMMALILSATGAPPTGQAFTGASHAAIAAASPSHPAYPHPPQLFPGSSALTATSFSFTGTLNFSEAIPRRIAIISPVPPTTTAARIIAVI